MDILVCTRCGDGYERPSCLSTSQFSQNGFVCINCRCRSCSIVLHFSCECGVLHGEPSQEDPSICVECANINSRVADVDIETDEMRTSALDAEDPIYGDSLVPMVDPIQDNGCPND